MPKRREVDKLATDTGLLNALLKRRQAVESGGLAEAPQAFRRGLTGDKKKKK